VKYDSFIEKDGYADSKQLAKSIVDEPLVCVCGRRCFNGRLDPLACSLVWFSGPSFRFCTRVPEFTLVKETSCRILDIRMPGMNGFELQDHLPRGDLWIPIVFVAAYANKNEENRAVELGAVALLRQPFSEQELLNVVIRALSR
jgi:CheY-like chemotaxis protein